VSVARSGVATRLGVPGALRAVETRSTPDVVIRHLGAVIKPGGVAAVRIGTATPSGRLSLLVYCLQLPNP